jgi:hypothetical protein
LDNGGQPGIAVPHQLHHDARWNARLIEQRCEGVPQCVEVDPASNAIDALDPAGRQISDDRFAGWHTRAKHTSLAFALFLPKMAESMEERLASFDPVGAAPPRLLTGAPL